MAKIRFRRSSVLVMFVLLSVFFPGSARAAVPVATSQWASSPVTIDGLDGDWGGCPLTHDKKSGADFAFRNDGRNLYVLMIIKNPASSKAPQTTGIKIFGRPGKSGTPGSGVLFLTRQVSAAAYIGWQVSQGAVLTEAEKAEIRKGGPREIHLAFAVGAKGSTFGPLGRPARGQAPDFGVAGREDGTAYEFLIPLASPEEIPGAIGALPGGTLRMSFEWGGSHKEELSTPASGERQGSNSGYVSGTGRTWSQEFLDTFDPMARPSSGAEKSSFSVDVKLAESR